jgi:hypothetical protein
VRLAEGSQLPPVQILNHVELFNKTLTDSTPTHPERGLAAVYLVQI